MRIKILLFFSLWAEIVVGQEFKMPKFPKEGKTINDFIPSGWAMLYEEEGELNDDKLLDAILVLKQKAEDEDTVIINPHYKR